MGCDQHKRYRFASTSPVSIHAPAWGATQGVLQAARPLRVSIHAPAWGATARIQAGVGCPGSFNPRTRVGCDRPPRTHPAPGVGFQSTHPRGVRHIDTVGIPPAEEVSIHAPAWGATAPLSGGCVPSTGFNPRTRVGCDRTNLGLGTLATQFQSTHPRGVRLFRGWSRLPRLRQFQSTHPRGVRRLQKNCTGVGMLVSIHAPAWGATWLDTYCNAIALFQSTHPRGVRLRCLRLCQGVGACFNPRTRVGCDSLAMCRP